MNARLRHRGSTLVITKIKLGPSTERLVEWFSLVVKGVIVKSLNLAICMQEITNTIL